MVTWARTAAGLFVLGSCVACGRSERQHPADAATGGAGGDGGARGGIGGGGGQGGAGGGSSGLSGGGVSGAGVSGAAGQAAECVITYPDPMLACELPGCSPSWDVSITCDETPDQDQTSFVLSANEGLVYVPLHNDGRLFQMGTDGCIEDPTFPYRSVLTGLTVNREGLVFAHGFVNGGYPLGRRAGGSWTIDSQSLPYAVFLATDRAGEPWVFSSTGDDTFTLTTDDGTADASWLGAPSFFDFDGNGVGYVIGYEPLHTGIDQIYLHTGTSPLELVEDPLRGTVHRAALPPLAADVTVSPEAALVRKTPEGLRLGWVNGGVYSESLIDGTASQPNTCPTGMYGTCQPDCENVRTDITQIQAARDEQGHAYVGFVRTNIDQTLHGVFDSTTYFCNINPSRDDTTSDVVVLRFDNESSIARPVLTLPDFGRVQSLRLSTFGSELGVAVLRTERTWRVARFGSE